MTNRKFIILFFLIIYSISSIYSQDNTGQNTDTGISENTNQKINQTNIEESMKIIDEETAAELNDADNTASENRSLVTFTVWDFLRMLLVLAVVAVCIYGLVFLLKKASTGRYDESELINVITAKTVAPGKSLHIIEVGNQMMLIGISDDSISHISDITDKETYEQIKLYKGKNNTPSGDSFYSYLSKVISPGRKGKGKIQNVGSLLEKHKKRMEKL